MQTYLSLRVGTVSLAILIVLRLTIWRRTRVLLLLVIAAVALLLLLMRAIVAMALAAVVFVARHVDGLWW